MSAVSESKLNWQAFGESIARRRKSLGVTQAEFAKVIGCDQPVVSVYERGDRQPTVEMCVRIAEALGVSLGSLLKPLTK